MKKNIYISGKQLSIIIILSFLGIFLTSLFKRTFNVDYINGIIFVFFIIMVLSYKPTLFLKYIYSFFTAIFMLAGLFICENTNIYLNELGTYAGHHGSFTLALVYFLIYFSILIYLDRKKSNKANSLNSRNANKNLLDNLMCKYIYVIFFAVGSIMFATVIDKPYFLLNIDRFQYAERYLPGIISKIENLFLYLTPILLFPVINKNTKIRYREIRNIIISLLPFILYGIWTGNKFGIFFRICFLILSPMIVYIINKSVIEKEENKSSKENINGNILKKEKGFKSKIIKILTYIGAFLIILLIPYYLLSGYDIKESLIGRTAQQGQLWWQIYDIYKDSPMRTDEFKDEMNLLFDIKDSNKSNYDYGVYKMMKLTTPTNIYNHKISTGSRYSAQGIEIAFYYFKYPGLVIHSILRAYFEVLCVCLLVKYCLSCRTIETIIISRLLIINHFVFSQGDLYLFFSWDTLLTILILIILEIVNKKYILNRNITYQN